MSADASPSAGRETVSADAFSALSTLHQLTLEAFLSHSPAELQFRILNRTVILVPYGRAFLWDLTEPEPRLLGVSGKSEVNPRLPVLQHCGELAQTLRGRTEGAPLSAEDFPGQKETFRMLDPGGENRLSPFWQPILVDGKPVAGLWMERWGDEKPWEERDTRVLASLMIGYAAAWEKVALRHRSLRNALKSVTRSRALIAAGILLVLLLVVRVQLRIAAPCEVIPRDPFVVAAPLNGVIAEVMVDPGEQVKAGDLLFRYDDRVITEELNVAKQQVEVIRSDLKRASVLAFRNERARAELILLENRLKQEEIRLRLAQLKAKRLKVRAERAGTVIVDAPHEWRGRSVAIGERVLSIVDPHRTQLSIWLPENDNIEFDETEAVQVFLNVAPNRTLEAKLSYVAKHISMTSEGVPSFRAEAEWIDTERAMRIGLTGTAMLYGEDTSVAYWLLRKPWGSLRRYFGF